MRENAGRAGTLLSGEERARRNDSYQYIQASNGRRQDDTKLILAGPSNKQQWTSFKCNAICRSGSTSLLHR